MIVSWFTQPENGFASYYQYETATKKFCRIRLELNREANVNDVRMTFIEFIKDRRVVFCKKNIVKEYNDKLELKLLDFCKENNIPEKREYCNPEQLKLIKSKQAELIRQLDSNYKWSLDNGKLFLDDSEASQGNGENSQDDALITNDPVPDYYVCDMTSEVENLSSIEFDKIHYGNVIVPAESAILPENVRAKHLRLLANEVMSRCDKNGIFEISADNCTPQELSNKILNEACNILEDIGVLPKNSELNAMSDDVILAALKVQAKEIGDACNVEIAKERAASIADAVSVTKNISAEISLKMVNGLTPSEELQKAFSELQATIENIKKIVDSGQIDAERIKEARAEFETAQEALNKTMEQQQASKYFSTNEHLDQIKDALSMAENSTFEWESLAVQSEKLAETNTIEQYSDEIHPEFEPENIPEPTPESGVLI